jgi:RNA polymerase sigma factor (sigma-70 family)
VEVSALTHARATPVLRGASPLLRLQSDERLIALTRRGQQAAFEVLCSRYQSRLQSFCRHMLGSREDAEDVLQEVFTAAFNAVLADEREINVRPWLYRIARNRSLNHLRRASAVGVDSMDIHFADHGASTGDRVIRRESFRELLADVHQLPETQRTALLLREIDALTYEQIAHAMETTVPSVKSLLVRARISLAEAAEARKLSCEEVRLELGEVAEGLVKLSSPARRHVRDCERCRSFKKQLKDNNHALAAMLPVGPLLMVKKLLLAKLGSTASAGSAHVAGGAGATVGAGTAASAGVAGGAGTAGGVFTVGAGALATKAVAGLAAAAIVGAGAVAANSVVHHPKHAAPASASVSAPGHAAEPLILHARSQPPTVGGRALSASAGSHRRHAASAKLGAKAKTLATSTVPAVPATTVPAAALRPAPATTGTQVTQVTTETTELPATATAGGQPTVAETPTSAGGATTSTTPATPTSTELPPPTTPTTKPPVGEHEPTGSKPTGEPGATSPTPGTGETEPTPGAGETKPTTGDDEPGATSATPPSPTPPTTGQPVPAPTQDAGTESTGTGSDVGEPAQPDARR